LTHCRSRVGIGDATQAWNPAEYPRLILRVNRVARVGCPEFARTDSRLGTRQVRRVLTGVAKPPHQPRTSAADTRKETDADYPSTGWCQFEGADEALERALTS